MPNVYDSQPAKYFALLEGWRRVIVAILELLQDVSCYHIHDYLDLFFGHHGDESTATACEGCTSMWPQLEVVKPQIDDLQSTVPFIRKVFWRRGPPTLRSTSQRLRRCQVGIHIIEVQAYHHAVLLRDNYDGLSAYVVAYGPLEYEASLIAGLSKANLERRADGSGDPALVQRASHPRRIKTAAVHKEKSPAPLRQTLNWFSGEVELRSSKSGALLSTRVRFNRKDFCHFISFAQLHKLGTDLFEKYVEKFKISSKHLLAGVKGRTIGSAWLYARSTQKPDSREPDANRGLGLLMLFNVMDRPDCCTVIGLSSEPTASSFGFRI